MLPLVRIKYLCEYLMGMDWNSIFIKRMERFSLLKISAASHFMHRSKNDFARGTSMVSRRASNRPNAFRLFLIDISDSEFFKQRPVNAEMIHELVDLLIFLSFGIARDVVPAASCLPRLPHRHAPHHAGTAQQVVVRPSKAQRRIGAAVRTSPPTPDCPP